MATTLLALVQDLERMGSYIGSVPSTLTDPDLDAVLVADSVLWINQAHRYLITDRSLVGYGMSWRFMWDRLSFDTTAAKGDYTPTEMGGGIDSIDMDSWTIYLKSAGALNKSMLRSKDYLEYRDRYGASSVDDARPWLAVEMPGRSVRFHPAPDAVYTAEADYYKTPSSMAVDADTMDIPDVYKEAVVNQALIYQWQQSESAEQVAIAQSRVSAVVDQMLWRELIQPDLTVRPE